MSHIISCVLSRCSGVAASGGVETLVVPVRVPSVHLSQEEIQRLRFKPTVGTIQCSEGSEVTFNCSIDLTDMGQDLSILWFKDGREIYDGTQTTVSSHGTVILLSKIRFANKKFYHLYILRNRTSTSRNIVDKCPVLCCQSNFFKQFLAVLRAFRELTLENTSAD